MMTPQDIITKKNGPFVKSEDLCGSFLIFYAFSDLLMFKAAATNHDLRGLIVKKSCVSLANYDLTKAFKHFDLPFVKGVIKALLWLVHLPHEKSGST
jgi:hypothetical protein